jgi:hypothetical protein
MEMSSLFGSTRLHKVHKAFHQAGMASRVNLPGLKREPAPVVPYLPPRPWKIEKHGKRYDIVASDGMVIRLYEPAIMMALVDAINTMEQS